MPSSRIGHCAPSTAQDLLSISTSDPDLPAHLGREEVAMTSLQQLLCLTLSSREQFHLHLYLMGNTQHLAGQRSKTGY